MSNQRAPPVGDRGVRRRRDSKRPDRELGEEQEENKSEIRGRQERNKTTSPVQCAGKALAGPCEDHSHAQTPYQRSEQTIRLKAASS